MPIEGFPEPNKHCVCFRCQKWHNPEEGSLQEVEGVSGGNLAANFAKTVAGVGLSGGRFVCYKCQKKRLRITIFVWSAFIVLTLSVLLAQIFLGLF